MSQPSFDELFPAVAPVASEGWTGDVTTDRWQDEQGRPAMRIHVRCGHARCGRGNIQLEVLYTEAVAYEVEWATNRLRRRMISGGWKLEPIVRCPDHVVVPAPTGEDDDAN